MAETKGEIQVVDYTFTTAEVQEKTPISRKLNLRLAYPRYVKCRAICQPVASAHQVCVGSNIVKDTNLCVFSYTEPVNGSGSFRELNNNQGQDIEFSFFEFVPTTGVKTAGLSEFNGTTEILTLSLTFIE